MSSESFGKIGGTVCMEIGAGIGEGMTGAMDWSVGDDVGTVGVEYCTEGSGSMAGAWAAGSAARGSAGGV